MYKLKYLFTILNDFVHIFHLKPVQNIITIKPPCVYSAHNDVIIYLISQQTACRVITNRCCNLGDRIERIQNVLTKKLNIKKKTTWSI